MEFDLRTCDAAYDFILEFLKMKPSEYIEDFIVRCGNDFEMFWDSHYDEIEAIDISDLRIMAFHVLGSLDECQEIRKNGLMNLQEVLQRKTILSTLLQQAGVTFNIPAKTVSGNGKVYSIDYDRYRSRHNLDDRERSIESVAHRVFYDFCVNGFMANDNVFNYGTRIHERPEFLITLTKLFPEAKPVEEYWERNSISYRVDFYVTAKQLHRFNFDLDEQNDPPYEGWSVLTDDMKIKKWMLSHAIDRSTDDLGDVYLYVKDNVIIPPHQIISAIRI